MCVPRVLEAPEVIWEEVADKGLVGGVPDRLLVGSQVSLHFPEQIRVSPDFSEGFRSKRDEVRNVGEDAGNPFNDRKSH
jgi:hypothetical protein